MTEIKVDKNIPLPLNSGSGGPSKYPWCDMEVGDSFFAPSTTKTMAGSIAARGKKYGEKHTIRAVTENSVKGVRVWRIK